MKRHQDPRQPDVPAETRKTADVPPARGSSEPQVQHAASHDERAGSIPADTNVTTRLRALSARAEPTTPVEAAAALIQLSLHESNGPVEDLSGALARMAQLVQSQPGAGSLDAQRTQLARDVAICIESLQFHDRLAQQLTQIRNLLATLAASDVPTDIAGRTLEGDPHNWLVLLENLRARFTSDSHRILFNLLLPGSGGRSSVPALHANEGSVELF
jgi:hypothetical protein